MAEIEVEPAVPARLAFRAKKRVGQLSRERRDTGHLLVGGWRADRLTIRASHLCRHGAEGARPRGPQSGRYVRPVGVSEVVVPLPAHAGGKKELLEKPQ